MEILRERELRENIEKQLTEEQKIKGKIITGVSHKEMITSKMKY